jgi:hypothetical protein
MHLSSTICPYHALYVELMLPKLLKLLLDKLFLLDDLSEKQAGL